MSVLAGVSACNVPRGIVAIESRGDGRGVAGQFIQHRDQFCDQYELAGLWRGIDDELPDPDGRA